MGERLQYPRYRWLVLFVQVLGGVTFGINMAYIAPILAEVAGDLGIDMGTAANLFTGYVLSSTIMLLIGGVVCDKFGMATAIAVGMLLASVPAVLMPWIGHGYTIVLTLRLIQGTATGFVVTTTGPILALWFPEEERGLGGGLASGSVSIGVAAGVVASPVIYTAMGSWQATSAILSVVGWVTALLALFILRRRPPAISPAGMPEQSALTVETAFPLKRIFNSPVIWIATFVVFFGNWALQPLANLVPAYLAADAPMGLGFGPVMAGKLSLAITVVGVFSTLSGGIFYDRISKGDARPPILIGFILMGIFAYSLLVPFVYRTTGLLVVCLLLTGWGAMFIYPAVNAFIVSNYPSAIVGRMVGLSFGLGGFGGVLALYVAGKTIARMGSFQLTIASISMASAAGVVVSLFSGNSAPVLAKKMR